MRLCEPINGHRTRKRMRAGMSPFWCGLPARRCCAHSHEQNTPLKHWQLFRSVPQKTKWWRAGTESPPRPATSRPLNVNVRRVPGAAAGPSLNHSPPCMCALPSLAPTCPAPHCHMTGRPAPDGPRSLHKQPALQRTNPLEAGRFNMCVGMLQLGICDDFSISQRAWAEQPLPAPMVTTHLLT